MLFLHANFNLITVDFNASMSPKRVIAEDDLLMLSLDTKGPCECKTFSEG